MYRCTIDYNCTYQQSLTSCCLFKVHWVSFICFICLPRNDNVSGRISRYQKLMRAWLDKGSALEQMTANMEYNASQKRKPFKSIPWNSSKFGGSPGCCKPPLHEQAYLEIKRCIIYDLWLYIIHIHIYIYIYRIYICIFIDFLFILIIHILDPPRVDK